jgi:hypothetical protein
LEWLSDSPVSSPSPDIRTRLSLIKIKVFDAWNLPEELRLAWAKRRELFLNSRKFCGSPITDMMMSPGSHFAMCLDMEGILGISWSLPKEEFEAFCCSLTE